jgi:uncharacterized membrane protein
MELRKNMRKRWFLVMRPDDANQPGSAWFRVGAASRGKVVVRPIAPEGWLALLVAIAAFIVATAAIWGWGHRSGTFSLAFAIMATVLVAGIVVAGLVRLIAVRMTTLPPEGQSR